MTAVYIAPLDSVLLPAGTAGVRVSPRSGAFVESGGGSGSALSGGVQADDATPGGSGFAGGGVSILSGNVQADDAAPGGSGFSGVGPGAIVVPALTNWNGGLQASITVALVTFLRLSDAVQVLTLSSRTTDGSGNLSVTNAALLVGTAYMVCGWNADGSQRFARAVTAT